MHKEAKGSVYKIEVAVYHFFLPSCMFVRQKEKFNNSVTMGRMVNVVGLITYKCNQVITGT